MLRTFFKGGHITLTPVPDERVYLAELVVLPVPMAEHKRRTPQLAAEAYAIRGCARAQCGLDTAILLAFERALVA